MADSIYIAEAAARCLSSKSSSLPHVIYDGRYPVMVSAPHVVEQFRDGSVKFSEPDTGTLAEYMAFLGYPTIYRCTFNNDDPNADAVSPYRNDLVSYIDQNEIRGLADIHQLGPSREMDVCLGTNFGGNISYEMASTLAQVFEDWGYSVTFDDPYSASSDTIVSKIVHEMCGIPAIQIEVNSGITNPDCSPDADIARFADALEDVLVTFSSLV